MVTEYVMTGGRGSGKTYDSMTEIHGRILNGDRPVILLVFPDRSDVEWWYQEWNHRFPHIQMPAYTGLTNTLGVKGRRWKYVYVNAADEIDRGWRNDKLWETVLVDLTPDAEIVYIYNKPEWADVAHTFSEYPPPRPPEPPVVKQGFLRRYLKRSQPVLDSE